MLEANKTVFVGGKFKEITPGVLEVTVDEYYRNKLDETAVKYEPTSTRDGSSYLVCREKLALVHKQESINAFGEKSLKFFLQVFPVANSPVVVVIERQLNSNTSRLMDAIIDCAGTFNTIRANHKYVSKFGFTYPQTSYTVD